MPGILYIDGLDNGGEIVGSGAGCQQDGGRNRVEGDLFEDEGCHVGLHYGTVVFVPVLELDCYLYCQVAVGADLGGDGLGCFQLWLDILEVVHR